MPPARPSDRRGGAAVWRAHRAPSLWSRSIGRRWESRIEERIHCSAELATRAALDVRAMQERRSDLLGGHASMQADATLEELALLEELRRAQQLRAQQRIELRQRSGRELQRMLSQAVHAALGRPTVRRTSG